MSSEELFEEYVPDTPEIQACNERLDKSEYVTRLKRKNRGREMFTIYKELKTKRNNTYVTILKYSRSGSSRNPIWTYEPYSIGIMDSAKGKCAILPYGCDKVGVVLQAHFLMRYKQRLYEESKDWKTRLSLANAKTLQDLMVLFVLRNQDGMWLVTDKVYGDKSHIFAPTNDGVMLLQFDGRVIQANTFITESMCSKSQKEVLDDSRATAKLEDDTVKLFSEIADKLFQKGNGNI